MNKPMSIARLLDGAAPESPLEARILEVLRTYEIYEKGYQYKLQQKVGIYRLDFAFPKWEVALEIDGFDYHTSPKQKARDRLRDEYISEVEGWKVERVPGWFAHRHPTLAVLKVMRHIPEFTKTKIFKNWSRQMITYHAKELIDEGYQDRGKQMLMEMV